MSKTTITREAAEKIYIDKRRREFERTFRAEAAAMCDDDLEKIISTDTDDFVIGDRSD